MAHVLILFQADTEPVEQLALAVAVGAVEAEGLIRLRRLATPEAPEVAHKSYGKLQEADLLWADVIVVGLEDWTPNPAELGPFFDLLEQLSLPSKHAWTFNPAGTDAPATEAQSRVTEALQSAGITMMPLASPPASAALITKMKMLGRLSATTREKI